MTVFDDNEPEDGWSPDDPVDDQLRNLRRRLAELLDSEDIWTDAVRELALLEAVLTLVRLRRLSTRSLLRADDLTTDIAYVRGRLP